MANLESDIKKIDDAIKELSAKQAYLVRSGGTPSQEINNAIQRLTNEKQALMQQLQQSVAGKQIAGKGSQQTGGGQRYASKINAGGILRIVLLGILAIAIFFTFIMSFGGKVFGLPQVQQVIQPATVSILNSVQNIGCWAENWQEHVLNPDSFKSDCGGQVVETPQGYTHVFSVTKESFKTKAFVSPDVAWALDATVVMEFYPPVDKTIKETDSVKAYIEKIDVITKDTKTGMILSATDLFDIVIDSCTKEKPCTFNPITGTTKEDRKRSVSIIFNWKPNVAQNLCDNNIVLEKREMTITAYMKYEFETYSPQTKISADPSSAQPQQTVGDVIGPVDVGIVPEDDFVKIRGNMGSTLTTIIVKNNGVGTDLGTATINKLEIFEDHDVSKLPMTISECGRYIAKMTPTVEGEGSTRERIYFENAKMDVDSGGDSKEIRCRLNATNAGEYIFRPKISYDFNLKPVDHTIKLDFSCPAK